MDKRLTRRSFLKVTATGGALLIGGAIPGLRGAFTAKAAGTFEPSIWLKIGADDSVTVLLTQIEMGQGVMTAMPMLVAEELDVDWNKIKTEWVPADAKYGNPAFGGAQITAGSNSVRGMWKLMREAGAIAHSMLITAAAFDLERSGKHVLDAERFCDSSGNVVDVRAMGLSWRRRPPLRYPGQSC